MARGRPRSERTSQRQTPTPWRHAAGKGMARSGTTCGRPMRTMEHFSRCWACGAHRRGRRMNAKLTGGVDGGPTRPAVTRCTHYDEQSAIAVRNQFPDPAIFRPKRRRWASQRTSISFSGSMSGGWMRSGCRRIRCSPVTSTRLLSRCRDLAAQRVSERLITDQPRPFVALSAADVFAVWFVAVVGFGAQLPLRVNG